MNYRVSETTAIQPYKTPLQSNIMLEYNRPQTLGNFVTWYEKLSFGAHKCKGGGIAGPNVCGNHDSMW